MKFGKREKGLGFAGWLILILVFGGGMTLGMKLFPVYLDHNTMVKILDGVVLETDLTKKRNDVIMDVITQRFKINGVRDYRIPDILEVKRDRKTVYISLDYEVRMPIVSNLAMIATFKDEFKFDE